MPGWSAHSSYPRKWVMVNATPTRSQPRRRFKVDPGPSPPPHLAEGLLLVGNELDVAGVLAQVAAQEVVGEVAGAVADGARARKVGVAAGQALLVVQVLVGVRLGQQVLNLANQQASQAGW